MAFPLSLKPVGYGFAAFVAGTLVMTVLGSGLAAAGSSSIGKVAWFLFTVLGYSVPVIAGYVAAYSAPARRILHGTVGGTIGVVLLLAPAFVTPDYSWAGVPVVVAVYAALASLGAILGKHRRDKVGP